MKRCLWIVAGIIISASLCLLILNSILFRSSSTTITWGGPVFTVSEWDYFIDQMVSLREVWRQRNPEVASRRNATKNDRLLAIDLEHRILWIEKPESSVPTDFVELPAALDWSLYYYDANDLIQLPSFLCFTPPQTWRWDIALVGQRQTGEDIVFVFSRGGMKNIFWNSQLDPNALLMNPFRKYKGPFSSFIIFDSERLDSIAQHCPSKTLQQDTDAYVDRGLAPDMLNKIAWQHLQKTLYRTLEQKTINAGFEVERITTQPGPDCSAGLAGLRLAESQPNALMQLLRRLIHRTWRSTQQTVSLTIEADRGRRWHCQSIKVSPGMLSPGPTLDFYIDSPSGSPLVDISDRREPDIGNSKWSLTLSNGTSVEIVGLCTHNGKDWWGPDGMPLDHWPGFFSSPTQGYHILREKLSLSSVQYAKYLSEFRGWLRSSVKSNEHEDNQRTLVLRIPSSSDSGLGREPLLGKDTALYRKSSPLVNRFGRPVFAGQYITLTFDQRQNVIPYCIGIHLLQDRNVIPAIISENGRFVGSDDATPLPRRLSDTELKNLPMEWIKLDNLSLQPGNITDFQMMLTDDPCDVPNKSRFAIQPRSMRQSPSLRRR